MEEEIMSLNVYDEKFLIAFYNILDKFVKEYDDMDSMSAIQKAKELLDIFNDK